MYLPPRHSTATVHEYLAPGVEIVSVDPNCVYNSPICLSDTTNSDAEDDDDCCSASDDEEEPLYQHQHQQQQQVAGGCSVVGASTSGAGVAAMPATAVGRHAATHDESTVATSSAMCPTSRSQTCLDNLNEENFDLAAYITDNDFDYTTNVDHTDDLLAHHQHQLPVMHSHQSTPSFAIVDDACQTPAVSVCAAAAAADDVAAISEAAVQAVQALSGDADTYHYVEKWLESCLHGDESTAESICLSLVGGSPVKLLLGSGPVSLIDDNATAAATTDEVVVQQPQQHAHNGGKKNIQRMIFDEQPHSSHSAPTKVRPVLDTSSAYRRPPQPHVGKGRGKQISMFAVNDSDDDDDDDDVDVEGSDDVMAVDIPAPSSAARTSVYVSSRKAAAKPVAVAAVPTTQPFVSKPLASSTRQAAQRQQVVAQKRMPGQPPVVHHTNNVMVAEAAVSSAESEEEADNYAPSQSSNDSCSSEHSSVKKSGQQQQRAQRAAARRSASAITAAVAAAPAPTQSTATTTGLRQQRGGNSGNANAPGRRKFRSKSYISSSSCSSDDENSNRDQAAAKRAHPDRVLSDTNVKIDAVVVEATVEASRKSTNTSSRSLLKPVQQPRGTESLLKTAKSAAAVASTSVDMKRHHSADNLQPSHQPRQHQQPAKRKLSVASASSSAMTNSETPRPGSGMGALEETLLSLDDGILPSQDKQPLRKQRKLQTANHRSILMAQSLQLAKQMAKPTSRRPAVFPTHVAQVGVRPPRASLLRVRSMDAGTSKTQAAERRVAVAVGVETRMVVDGQDGENMVTPAVETTTAVAVVREPESKPTNNDCMDVKMSAEVPANEEAAEQQHKKRLNLDEYLKRRRQNEPANASAESITGKPIIAMANFKIPKKAVSTANKPTTAAVASTSSKSADARPPLRSQNLEEIVIVSMGCNTDITLPCGTANSDGAGGSLLTNINDTIINAQRQQGEGGAGVKISCNSLIASIQDVLIKKCLPPVVEGRPTTTTMETGTDTSELDAETATASTSTGGEATAVSGEHGEDKVIMYLPKDRRRAVGQSVECQTETVLQFAPLKRLRRYRSHRHHRRRHSRRASATSYHRGQHRRRDHRDRTRSRSRSRDRSSSYSRSSSSDSSSGSSSSSSSASSSSSSSSSSASSYDSDSRRRSRSRSNGRQSRDRSAVSNSVRSAHQNGPVKYYADGERSQSRNSRLGSSDVYRNGESLSRSDSESSGSGASGRLAKAKAAAAAAAASGSSAGGGAGSSTGLIGDNGDHDAAAIGGKGGKAKQPSAEQTKIIEERRIVYVGRIEDKTNKEELRKKFMGYGLIRQITIHYKDTGMKFGFVTYEHAKDAYRAIDCSMKDPAISMYDVSFGGRRAFCKSSYMDLDGNPYGPVTYSASKASAPAASNESFEELLRKMREKLNEKRTTD